MSTNQSHNDAIQNYFNKNQSYWSSVYGTPPKLQSFRTYEMIRRKDQIIDLLRKEYTGTKLTILDVGCGSARIAFEIKEWNVEYFGLDLSCEMISEARRAMNNLDNFICGEIEHIPIKAGQFDIVICAGVIQYLESDFPGLSELKKMVKAKGILILTLPNILRLNNIFDPYYYLIRLPSYIIQKFRKNAPEYNKEFGTNKSFHNRRYFLWQLYRYCKLLNLSIDHVYSVCFGPWTFFRKVLLPQTWTRFLSNLLESFVNYMNLSLFHLFANRWIIYIKKNVNE